MPFQKNKDTGKSIPGHAEREEEEEDGKIEDYCAACR
jgi:hypothetical protein